MFIIICYFFLYIFYLFIFNHARNIMKASLNGNESGEERFVVPLCYPLGPIIALHRSCITMLTCYNNI